MAQQLFKKVGQQMLTKLDQQMLTKIGQQMFTKIGQQMLTKIGQQLFHTIATDGRLAGANQQMFLPYTIAFCHAWPILLSAFGLAVIPLLLLQVLLNIFSMPSFKLLFSVSLLVVPLEPMLSVLNIFFFLRSEER